MRVLLDECLPRRLKQSITGHDVATVSDEEGYQRFKGGLHSGIEGLNTTHVPLGLTLESYDWGSSLRRSSKVQTTLAIHSQSHTT